MAYALLAFKSSACASVDLCDRPFEKRLLTVLQAFHSFVHPVCFWTHVFHPCGLNLLLQKNLMTSLSISYQIDMRFVLERDIVFGAMLRDGGSRSRVLRMCLQGHLKPLIGLALFSEMEDILSRVQLFQHSELTAGEREELFAAFLSVTQLVPIY